MDRGQHISNILLLLLICLSTSSKVAAEAAVRIGIGVLKPWKYQVEGKLQGAEVDMLDAVSKQLKLKPEYVV